MDHSPNHLSFRQLKLAMRRFYYGPRSGISTDSLSYTQVRQYPIQSIRPDIISLFSTEAQICPKHLGLCIRMHDIVLVRTLDDLILDPGREWGSDPLYTLEVCAHCHLLTLITPIVEFLHYGEKTSIAYTCYKCNTDSKVEIGGFDSKIALIMTRWVNLGPGLAKDDLLWKTHVRFTEYPRPRLDENDTERLVMGVPRFCFEDMAPQSFEDLQSRNLSYLRDQKYKTPMPFIAAGLNVWYMSCKEPPKKRGRGIETLRSLLRHSTLSRENRTIAKTTRQKPTFCYSPSPNNRPIWEDREDLVPLILYILG